MSEGRIILVVFAIVGCLLIALPVGMLLSSPQAGDEKLNGEVAKFFFGSPKQQGPRQVLPDIVTVLPAGLSADDAFKKMAASGFTCVPDSRSASCFRDIHESCMVEWRVSLVFDERNLLTSSEADRRTTCS